MTATEEDLLSEVEKTLQEKFSKKESFRGVPSTARPLDSSDRVDQLTLSDDQRPKMPFTQDKYVIKENPHLIQWEREVRKFLRKLNLTSGHRVSAVMIYEWATGIKVAELVAAGGNANSELRQLNKVLRFYFGKSYSTYIMGRKVPNAYRVPVGYRIRRHRPMTMALYAEYTEGVLNP